MLKQSDAMTATNRLFSTIQRMRDHIVALEEWVRVIELADQRKEFRPCASQVIADISQALTAIDRLEWHDDWGKPMTHLQILCFSVKDLIQQLTLPSASPEFQKAALKRLVVLSERLLSIVTHDISEDLNQAIAALEFLIDHEKLITLGSAIKKTPDPALMVWASLTDEIKKYRSVSPSEQLKALPHMVSAVQKVLVQSCRL